MPMSSSSFSLHTLYGKGKGGERGKKGGSVGFIMAKATIE